MFSWTQSTQPVKQTILQVWDFLNPIHLMKIFGRGKGNLVSFACIGESVLKQIYVFQRTEAEQSWAHAFL